MIPKPYLTFAAGSQAGAAFERHREHWHDCTRCGLHKDRKQVVLARGQLPCHVAFIGEAPGHSEDSLGVPFVGEAGYMMQQIIDQVKEQLPFLLRYCLCNVVACQPLGPAPAEDAASSRDIRVPTKDEALACSPRLQYFLSVVARPKLIVTIGRIADMYAPIVKQLGRLVSQSVFQDEMTARKEDLPIQPIDLTKIPWGSIVHPGYIVRLPALKQGLHIKRSVLTVVELCKQIETVKV